MTESSSRIVNISKSGEVTSRRYHLFPDCSMLDDGGMNQTNLTEREAGLLGLVVCKVCEKRASGGPALDVLEGFFGEDWTGDGVPKELAWRLIGYLKERGFYLSQRQTRELKDLDKRMGDAAGEK